MERVEQFKSLLESFTENYEKFMDKGNNTAGTRARKALQEMRNLAKETRDDISKTRKEREVVA
jgi:ElaB/YqjD/DUF883 family membrane-anchored ribosome-binding protein